MSDLGLYWLYVDFEVEGFGERLYRLVFPTPSALGLNDELWFQVEHHAKELVSQHWPGRVTTLYERGRITDPDALRTLEAKVKEWQAQNPIEAITDFHHT
jgi:hypothetical protein